MEERPINLRHHEVRGIIDGQQTHIRRVVKPQPTDPRIGGACTYDQYGQWVWLDGRDGSIVSRAGCCPFGAPGDRLWGRESFIHEPADYCWEASVSIPCRPACTIYRADAEDPRGGAWKPSTQMPRELSRITLDLVSVRVERLQDISIEDAKAEGAWPDESIVQRVMDHFRCDAIAANPYRAYQMLWEQLNGPGSWDANPLVWVLYIREA